MEDYLSKKKKIRWKTFFIFIFMEDFMIHKWSYINKSCINKPFLKKKNYAEILKKKWLIFFWQLFQSSIKKFPKTDD